MNWGGTTRVATAATVVAALLAVPLRGQEAIKFHLGKEQPVILLKVKVNGVERVALLDTGGSRTITTPAAAGMSKKDLGASPLTTLGGGKTAMAYRAVRLEFGGKRWSGLTVIVTDLQAVSENVGEPVELVLGMDVLSQFHAFRVDFRKGVLELEP